MYTVTAQSPNGLCVFEENAVRFTAKQAYKEAKWSVSFALPTGEEPYVFSPACAYNGNRFERVDRPYPPMYKTEETGENARPLMRRVPALEVDGSGAIEVTSGDMTTPCVGYFYEKAKRAFFVFTEQCVKGKNLGFRIELHALTVQFPADRRRAYTVVAPTLLVDCWQDAGAEVRAGEVVESRLLVREFACENFAQFFDFFLRNRKCLLSGERSKNGYTQALWEVMERHFNEHNWSGEYYAEASKIWQCGWVGGGMSSYPLLKMGTPLSKARAVQTLDWLTSHTAPTGFFYGLIREGRIEDDSFYNYGFATSVQAGYEGMKHAHLIRKSGDGLYFLYKHFALIEPKRAWVDAARGCADAFVTLFERYGTFGQFVNIETGKMLVGVSSAGGSAVGALVKSWEYFGDERYLETAKKAGEFYYQNFVARGVTSGGPGEILCAPDQESAYGLLESYVVLYEATKEEKWLTYARDSANLFSSWVFSYTYEWLVDCEFKTQNINTLGSVFANVQNKHSAPGICTFSGDTLYRLWKYTGEPLYLELIQDIVFFLPQCVSTEERPIYTWVYPHGDERGKLPAGYVCERVNTSDWETEQAVGGVFNGSCWCETTLILIFAELGELIYEN